MNKLSFKIRILPLICAFLLIFSVAGCTGKTTDSSADENSSTTTNDESEQTTGSEEETTSGSEGSTSPVSDGTTSAPGKTQAGTTKKPGSATTGKNTTTSGKNNSTPTVTKTKTFRVEDFGAKGDGVHDDGPAISKAIIEAGKDKSAEKIVQFKANATYRIASAPETNSFKRVMNVIGAENVKIRGNNTKLLMKAPYRVAYIYESKNIEFSGFIIDYDPKPFVSATVKEVNVSKSYIDFECKHDLGFTGTVNPPSPYFAFRNRKDERLHFNITSMTKMSNNTYRFYMADPARVQRAVVGESFILPVYGSSHNIGGIFTLEQTENCEVKNVTVYSMPDFGFGLRENSGTIRFTNVQIKPEPGSDVYLASWRDGFHIKDNYGKLIWDNCYIGPLGDDAFNLSSVICNVDFYNADTRVVNMTPAEGSTVRNGIKVGDELVAYNMTTGDYYGIAKVEKVLSNTNSINIRIDRSLPIVKGCQIGLYSFNKDFVVKNSYIEGTVRVRSTGTFENCEFNVFWVRVENESYVEGPVPKDILFKNCTFKTPYTNNPVIFHVGTLLKTGLGGMPKYKCKNIVLQNCNFVNGRYNADSGNELIIK